MALDYMLKRDPVSGLYVQTPIEPVVEVPEPVVEEKVVVRPVKIPSGKKVK